MIEYLIVIGIEATAIIFMAGTAYSALRNTQQVTNHLNHRMAGLEARISLQAERLASIEGMVKMLVGRR
tara:strand:- start:320 stop:526 length:207 start_codon:yes stop_codon:yes gene_type:complete